MNLAKINDVMEQRDTAFATIRNLRTAMREAIKTIKEGDAELAASILKAELDVIVR